ncbi:hypothetical protein L3Q82_001875 [Scortum barcoo]|uniref:Uncharacterized protein n=1 Tax=Scortum barcoo TaxID=214431 RepID=A0ACB8W5U3_9TELE|nr:hypothetical protein L3Q82_001875 [Scortum barcoo]
MSHREEAPRGRPRTRWRNYVSRLAWERLEVPPEELEEVSGVQKDHVTPIYVINLLISDILQLCYMIIEVARPTDWILYEVFNVIYLCGLTSSVGFMVCVAMERYLVVAWPLWYRFRRTIKSSVVVCVVVWVLCPLVLVIFLLTSITLFAIFLLLPLPLFIFFLGGTIRALSASQSVPSDEKRRIVGCLVLVMLIYTLLFLPTSIFLLADRWIDGLSDVSFMFLKLSPLADLGLYVFMKKGAIDKLLASVCRCRMDSNEISS